MNPNNMIGRNVRPGLKPGGFSQVFGSKKSTSYVRKGRESIQVVKDAADAALAKRGLINEPNMRDAHNGFGRFG